MKTVAIICPVFNEEENIEIYHERFNKEISKNNLQDKYNFYFLFADNKSLDNSKKIIKQLKEKFSNIKMISYSRNFGVMKSLFTAIRSLDEKTDSCLIFDCDLQDPPELMSEFLKNWENGFKIVYGVREKRIEGLVIKNLRKVFKKIDFFFRGYKVDIESGAWLLDKAIINQFKKSSFDQYLPGLIARLGYDTTYVKYNREKRKKGKTKFGFTNYFSYALDGIFNGSITPLRISVIFLILFFLSFFVSSIYFLLAKFVLQIEFDEGVAAIAIINLFGFSIIFLILSIVCEYIGRIYKTRFEPDEAIIEERIE